MVDIASVLILFTGFMLGLGHSLDPDHIVAVSTLLCNSTSLRKSIVSATAWGAGHSVVLIVVGLLVLALLIVIPEGMVDLFEFAAGTMLIILGVLVIKPFVAHKLQGHQDENTLVPAPLDSDNKSHNILTCTNQYSRACCRDWQAARQ